MELVEIRRRELLDDDGYPLDWAEAPTTVAANVEPLSSNDVNGVGVAGELERLKVFLPAGTVINTKDVLLIRGEAYTVTGIPFDWGIGRKRRMTRHKPRVVVIVERGEG